MRLAVGAPGEGLEGFRRTLRRAELSRAVALAGGERSASVVFYQEVAPVALMAEDFGELQLLFHAGRLTTLGRPAPHWWRADTSLTVSYTVCLSHSSDLTRRKGDPSLLGAESGFPAITEPPPDHEPLSRAARSGENLIEENHKSEVVTKAASTHANWWGYYRQKD